MPTITDEPSSNAPTTPARRLLLRQYLAYGLALIGAGVLMGKGIDVLVNSRANSTIKNARSSEPTSTPSMSDIEDACPQPNLDLLARCIQLQTGPGSHIISVGIAYDQARQGKRLSFSLIPRAEIIERCTPAYDAGDINLRRCIDGLGVDHGLAP
jgi:hypothetical protein